MALNIEQKKAVVAEVSEVAKNALSAVAAEYRGLTVEELTDLRVKARQGGVYVKVAKNTLVRRAVEGTEFECLSDELTGPLLLAFSMEDPGAAARLVKDYAKEHDLLVAKTVAIGGQVFDASGRWQSPTPRWFALSLPCGTQSSLPEQSLFCGRKPRLT